MGNKNKVFTSDSAPAGSVTCTSISSFEIGKNTHSTPSYDLGKNEAYYYQYIACFIIGVELMRMQLSTVIIHHVVVGIE